MRDGSAVMFTFSTSDNSREKFHLQLAGRFSEVIHFFSLYSCQT